MIADRYEIEVVYVGTAGHLPRYKVTRNGVYVSGGLFKTRSAAESFIDMRRRMIEIREAVEKLRSAGFTHDADLMENGLQKDTDLSRSDAPEWKAAVDGRVERRAELARTLLEMRGLAGVTR
jgi:hypothetical protein